MFLYLRGRGASSGTPTPRPRMSLWPNRDYAVSRCNAMQAALGIKGQHPWPYAKLRIVSTMIFAHAHIHIYDPGLVAPSPLPPPPKGRGVFPRRPWAFRSLSTQTKPWFSQ